MHRNRIALWRGQCGQPSSGIFQNVPPEQMQSGQCAMSVSYYHPSIAISSTAWSLRFGVASSDGEPSLQWLLRRNCSSTPQQMAIFFASLCVLSVGIAVACWLLGATLVVPFAGLELIAVATALLLYARHASDRECIHLRRDRLTVEHVSGRSVERVEFAPAWVRVEPQHGDRSLVELSGEGRRIAVGRFVRPELRRQLADELRWALRRGHAARAPGAAAGGAASNKFEN